MQQHEREDPAPDEVAFVLDACGAADYDLNLASGALRPSPRLNALYGYPATHPLTLADCLARANPDDRGTMESALTGSGVPGEPPIDDEFRILLPDGAVRWVRFRGDIVLDAAGHPTRRRGVAIDITAGKRAEEQLRHANERFRLAETAATSFSYEWNLETGAVQRTEALARVLGYQPNEIAPTWQAWAELMHPDDRAHQSEAEAIAFVRGAGQELIGGEYRVRHKAGHEVWVLERAMVLRDAQGEARRLIGQTVDITARKQLEIERERLYAQEQAARAQAEEASRLKDAFLATVSHELRTPLTAFLGYTQLLRRRAHDPAYVARTLALMAQSAQIQAQLIEDLLDIARIAGGKLRLEPRLLDLHPVVEAALDTVRPAVAAKGLQLHVDLDSAAGQIMGDPSRLQQVVWNLLANAAKFTQPHGSIAVRLANDGDDVRLTVSDTGQGIPPDFLPFVFERFRQADSSNQRMHGGLGLGLALVRHLVELHGGTVAAASAGEGQGATFTVRLPVAEPGAVGHLAPGTGETQARAAPGLYGLRVLVVDDQPAILELLGELLDAEGAFVERRATAREALAAVRSWRPDVLVSDMAMPGEDGYWLIRQVRELPVAEGGATPAVALTAYVRREEQQQVVAAGFQGYLSKPVDPAELWDVLARLAPPHSIVGRPISSRAPGQT